MGFFIQDTAAPVKPSIELYHRLQCKVCPLAKITANKHPHMAPTGSDHPIVYICGEAPGENEDIENEQFVGLSGQLLRARIPRNWQNKIRWNNVVRTRPPKNRTPTEIEIECCRPSIVEDISRTKPKAIFGFGGVPLDWVAGLDRILLWRGRRMPVRIGTHECWYYPMLHPSFLLHRRKEKQWIKEGDRKLKPTHIGSEEERMFVFDLQHAFAEVEDLPWPEVHTEETARYGVEILDGRNGDLQRLEKLLNWAANQRLVGVDYETNGIRPYAADSKILTAAVGTDELSFAFALHHKQTRWDKADLLEVKRLWVKFLRAPKVRKAVHFLNFEMEWTAYFYSKKLLYDSLWEDTATQSSVIDERLGKQREKAGPLSLEWLVQQYFGFNLKALSNLDRAKLDDAPLPEVLRYNAMDAKYHCLLFQKQEEVISNLEQHKQYRHCLARVPTCVLSQLKGIPANRVEGKRLKKNYKRNYDKADQEIAQAPEVLEFNRRHNKTFNPESHPDVTILFRDQLKFKQGWQTDKHGVERYTVDKHVLDKINHPIGNAIIRLREAGKLLSYVYEDKIWPDGLLHTNLNTLFVETKRLSSDSPNCFPPDVEVLTKQGWVRWDQISENDVLAQFDVSNQSINFAKPIKLIKHKYKGVLQHTYSTGQQRGHVSLVSTKNHRILRWGKHEKKSVLQMVTVEELSNWSRLIAAGIYEGGTKSFCPSQITLIAAFQADAYWSKLDGYISWGFHKRRKFKRLRKALVAENIPFREKSGNKEFSLYVARRHVPEWLKLYKMYGPWILELDRCSLTLLAEELWYWDGCSTSKNDFCSKLKQNSDWVQILLTLSNQRSRVSIRKSSSNGNNYYFATRSSRPYTATATLSKSDVEFDGFVYCATMPKDTLIVRYEGRAIIVGNCQNIPKRDEEGKEIRKQIEAPDGYVVAAIDYGQIQGRGIAMTSGDKNYIQALWERYDVHGDWAERLAYAYPSRVGGKQYLKNKPVLKKFRDEVKNKWTFPLFFGSRMEACANDLKIPEIIVGPEHRKFTKMFAGVFEWHERVQKFYQDHGYVEDLFGLRRHGPLSHNRVINSPIQLLEGVIVMDAMNRLSRRAHETQDDNYQPNIQIHDDLTFFLPENKLDKYVGEIVNIMLDVKHFKFINVPITLEVSIGKNLYKMQPVLDASSDGLWNWKI